jgi:hypothetical protein
MKFVLVVVAVMVQVVVDVGSMHAAEHVLVHACGFQLADHRIQYTLLLIDELRLQMGGPFHGVQGSFPLVQEFGAARLLSNQGRETGIRPRNGYHWG